MNLSDFFTTKGEAVAFSIGLATLSDKIYTTDFQLEKTLLEIFGIQKKELFLRLLRENSIPSDSANTLKTFVENIQSTIASMPTITLTIAFEPTPETLKAITNWFVMNIKKQVLIEFTVDPSLIAGAKLTYNGVFKDYSVKEPVEKLIQALVAQTTTTTSPAANPPNTPQPNIHQSIQHMTFSR